MAYFGMHISRALDVESLNIFEAIKMLIDIKYHFTNLKPNYPEYHW